jgi:hypothetical protein
MKFIILNCFFFLSLNFAYSNTLIISDVDDTIKVTNVLNKKDAVLNGLFSRKAFSGMSELYQEFNTNDSFIYYLSGSPKILNKAIESFFDINEFPQPGNLILKSTLISTYFYKLNEIRNLICLSNPDDIILIGDDTEVDPEVYDVISKEYESKVKSIYIRAIKNRGLPSNDLMKSFFSPVEIAGFELLRGHFSISGLVKVTSAFVAQKKDSQLKIAGRYCPAEGRLQIEELKHIFSDQQTLDLLTLTQETIIKACIQN